MGTFIKGSSGIDVKEQLKDTVRIEDVAHALGFDITKRTARELKTSCPVHHGQTDSVSINIEGQFFKCFGCDYKGDLFSMVMGKLAIDFKDALKWLCQNFRTDLLPEISKREYNASPEVKKFYERASLLDMLYQHGKDLLYGDRGKDALAYLTGHRKYDVETLKKTEWFYLLPDLEARDYLRKSGATDDALKEFHLQGYWGDVFRLAFPYRDRRGAITGFVKRAIEPKGIEIERDGKKTLQRFDSSKGTEKTDIFNLYKCKGADTVVIVEGYPDSIYLTALGIPTVAFGQASISQAYVEGLIQFDVKRVIISLDNDAVPKHDATLKALEAIRKTRKIKGYVIDPTSMTPNKDLDEVYRAEGIEKVRKLIESPLTDAEYTARRIMAKHDISQAIEYDKAKEELFTYADNDYLDFTEATRVIDFTRTALNIPPEVIEGEISAIHSKRNREEEQAVYTTLARDLSKAESIADARKLIKEAQEDGARLSAGDTFPPPFDGDRLKAFLQEKKDRGAGYKTGYPSLDGKGIRIRPGAITLIGGRPGHGKTTFMLNMLVNMLRDEEYRKKSFFFFTYEEPAGDLTVKIINLLAGKVLDEYRNTDAIEEYLQQGKTTSPELNKAHDEFKTYVKSGQLYIVNEAYTAEALTAHISTLADRYDMGPVFLDYIQKIRPGKAGDHYSRQTEVQYVSNLLLNEGAIRNNVPIVSGAQLNREAVTEEDLSLEQFREAGDLEQDANTALFVWNKQKEKRQLERAVEDPNISTTKRTKLQAKLDAMNSMEYDRGDVPLNVHIMKNRGGGGEGVRGELIFNGPTLKIIEQKIGGM